ncbi:MarR family winged helix-turn-helix transcriptional regulator [Paenibacillus sp. 481]|uniref:MarR family winged helix-turn-helix transcriptional regulator n=1 Tax=Paenibacillus sp. 481 TaxID=2835869 RepID=UPI001E6490ED|nr:MarR family transcriptional regulator [Paenibacillus sp. 481]UHA72699.1 MarR family transcriptional regulator [Paenibacillus sp. 481]
MEPIEDCLTFLLGKASQRAYQIAKAKLQPYGVTPVQHALLHLLWEKDGQHSSELGERLRLDSATMTGLLDRLAQSELIERRPSPTDRRMNHIFLTPRSQELQAPLSICIEDTHKEALQDFTADEIAQLKGMLARFIGLHP